MFSLQGALNFHGFWSLQHWPWGCVSDRGREEAGWMQTIPRSNHEDCWLFCRSARWDTSVRGPLLRVHSRFRIQPCGPSCHESDFFNSLQLELTLAWGLQICLYTTYRPALLACIPDCSAHRCTGALLNTLAIYTYSVGGKNRNKHGSERKIDGEYAQGHSYKLKHLMLFTIFGSHT